MKPIKQSVINTFYRVGIDSELDNTVKNRVASNWLTGETCEVTELVLTCINWVYHTQLLYESGSSAGRDVPNLSDFDRVRYFILDQDAVAYSTCID